MTKEASRQLGNSSLPAGQPHMEPVPRVHHEPAESGHVGSRARSTQPCIRGMAGTSAGRWDPAKWPVTQHL